MKGGASVDADVTTGVGMTSDSDMHTTSASSVGGIPAALQVQNDTDLDSYSMSVKQQDSSVSEVSSDSDSVSVDYKIPAKLFGFISVDLTEKASVKVKDQSTTDVTVSRPWWSVFAKADDHKDALTANIKSRIGSNVAASSDVSAGLSASAKAQLISAIEAGARDTFASSASASASGSAQY